VNLSESLKSISSTLSKPLSDIKYKTVTEESINAQLEDTAWALKIAESAMTSLTEKQFNAAYARILNRLKMEVPVLNAIGKPAADWIMSIDKNLQGKAKTLGLYKALLLTSKNMYEMIEQLQSSLTTILTDKGGVVVNDMQVSHSILFGAIESAKTHSSMNSYLLAVISHIISMPKSGDDGIPKYMLDFLVKNGPSYIELVNTTCNSNENVVAQIMSLRKNGVDFSLGGNDTKKGFSIGPLLTMLGKVLKNPKVIALIVAFTLILSKGWIGEKYIDIRHSYYEWLKERKKWLEIHVANIKLSLEDMDENDPEYIKTQKIAAFYDDKIADIEKKLQDYYND
jgi:hypothetical protein